MQLYECANCGNYKGLGFLENNPCVYVCVVLEITQNNFPGKVLVCTRYGCNFREEIVISDQ